MLCSICGTPIHPGTEKCRACGSPSPLVADEGAPSIPAPAPALLPPRRPLTRLADPDAPFDRELWAAAIGPRRTAYYLRQFEAYTTLQCPLRWNWAAFFMTTPWLIYRKMPKWALGYLLAPWVLFPLAALSVAIGQRYSVEIVGNIVACALGLGCFVACVLLPGSSANSLYMEHCRKLIQEQSFSSEDRDMLLQKVSRAGGTRSPWLIAAAFSVIVLITIVAASLFRQS